jgi:hypothetical protein
MWPLDLPDTKGESDAATDGPCRSLDAYSNLS